MSRNRTFSEHFGHVTGSARARNWSPRVLPLRQDARLITQPLASRTEAPGGTPGAALTIQWACQADLGRR